MQFTRLRILGFKSFVEPTEFVIEPGLTGVVGPNGCGKSNLVEALRWVMGEASYKNMRASGMDDVIFSGSLNRPARNTAEVSLAIDNADRTAPVAFNESAELEITRRIEREAGSVYKVNGRDVRQRDVQLLFADASTGAHSPAMVGQGRIGELIAAKPQDRRALLEEAAGISGLHNRRHEAELRLSAAEQNLGRLDDVVAEIDTQLDQLKRQARQAVRYRNLSGEIRKAEATVLHLRWRGTKEHLAESESALLDLTRIAGERGDEQVRAATREAEAAAALPALRDAAARAGAALQRIIVARDALDHEEARVKDRLVELDRRLAQLAEDVQREERMIADNRVFVARLDDEEQGLEAANAAMDERQATAGERRRVSETALAESERRLGVLTQELAEVTARRGQLARAVAEADDRIGRQRRELAGIENELAGLDASAPDAGAATHAKADLESAEGSLLAAEQAAIAAEGRTSETRTRNGEARAPLAEAEQALGRIEAESATLVALLAISRVDGETPVLDSVKVAHGYEDALGAAFGDDLDAATDEAAAIHWRSISAAEDDPRLPVGSEPLSNYVEAPAVLSRRLAQTGIVTAATGPGLQALLKPGQRLVTRAGDLWRWDGYTAAAGSSKAAAQRLASRNRLGELEIAAGAARSAVAEKWAVLEATSSALRTAEGDERGARDAWRSAQKNVDEKRAALAATEREAARLATRRSALGEAQSRIAQAIAEQETRRTDAANGLAATADPAALTPDLAAARDKVNADRAALAEARAAVESLARETEMRSRRLAAIKVERKNWQERGTNAEAQIAILSTRQGEATAERERLSDEPAKIEVKRVALLSEIATAEEGRKVASDALVLGENALAEADRTARAALDGLAEAREQRGRAEERAVAARQRLVEIAARIHEALDCAPEETAAAAGLGEDDDLPQLGETEARLERYKQERERLGAVNLRAEAEANEIAERRNAMVAERDDLIAAIQRLRQGIGSLNKEGRERLTAAFGTVNAHFQRLFTHLFGGGVAELQLTESDDPLEAGLEILARPPGKKPQIMTLLSGGEQALTAMALIFAVFLTNPAPICVLDEVDAPLDDANVERFCNLLEEMTRSTNTRFVVITHNPITMSRMSRLFGVTMAERGVSQLVSVDLQTAERFREAG